MPGESLTQGFVVAGKYAIERELGRGGMGAVYVVRHTVTGKRLALKTLLPQLTQDAELVGRFMREARAMGRMQHRHIVDVFDVGRDGEILYIVMELLQGRPLTDLLHAPSTTLEEVLVILVRAMDGLAAAHEVGVIHRDLKPDNIFVCVGASGRLDDPRVLDFGISRIDDPVNPRLTRTGVAMGTPFYMPYEQVSGLRSQDQRVDVYAMGVILYEAIAGQPPFVGASFSEIAVRMLTTEPADLDALRPDLPRGLWPVVRRAMARQPEQRYASMRDLMAALRPYLPNVSWTAMMQGRSIPLRVARASDPSPPFTRFQSALRTGSEPPPAERTDDDDDDVAEPRGLRWRRVTGGLAAVLALGAAAWWVRADALIGEVAALVSLRDAAAAGPLAAAGGEARAAHADLALPEEPRAAAPPAPKRTDASADTESSVSHASADDAGAVVAARADLDAAIAMAPEAVPQPGATMLPLAPKVVPPDARVRNEPQLARRPLLPRPDAGASPVSARPASIGTGAAAYSPPAALTPPAAPADSPGSTSPSAQRRAGRMGLSEF